MGEYHRSSMRRALASFSSPGSYSLLSLAIIKSWPHLAILLLQHGYDPNKCEIYILVKALQFSLHSLDDTARRVITCYLCAGHIPRPGDIQLMDNLQLPPNQGFQTEPIEWIKSQFGFLSLKQLCRNSIRTTMRKLTDHASIIARLLALSDVLPPSMVDYLTLAEFSIDEQPSRPLNLY